jgi:hypothetical protein
MEKKQEKEKNTMKKSAIKTCSILAILLLSLTSFTLLLGIESAEGAIVSMQWGHLAPGYLEDERDLEEDVCDAIYSLFDDDYWGSWATVNAYWSYTDTEGIETCMDWQNDPLNGVNFVTNWWLGDYLSDNNPPPNPWGHFWFHGQADNISDTFVNECATSEGTSLQYFNFIWTCANGFWWNDTQGNSDTIIGITSPNTADGPPSDPPSPDPTNTNDEYGFFYNSDAVGMPLAWTNTSGMDLDGYYSDAGSYTYIGFEGPSPFMINDLPETEDDACYFPLDFYWYALGNDNPYHYRETISESLDFTSDINFGSEFDETPFYNGYWVHLDEEDAPPGAVGWYFCHMRVLGNGDMVLP